MSCPARVVATVMHKEKIVRTDEFKGLEQVRDPSLSKTIHRRLERPVCADEIEISTSDLCSSWS